MVLLDSLHAARLPPHPFCVAAVSYCDFSIAVRKRIPAAEYVNAILREWEIG